ncbi:DUF1343 domain-containing protein [Bacillus horti]|uniref:Uncharacterized protein YbbC (DUF1343 family) n=1 Tax=Caldalkalibacillus horti TaxID=77523 RepID=A0ABT9VZJ4_9BACI|nr:DUF1343 domain-containing protein [Bacillus horti]MDQ0166294.1 uncharacterized protein YbbC (DUF1343 family) [Bacillus horti]
MKLGVDHFFEQGIKTYYGKRAGLVTNMTGVNRELVPTIDLFHQHNHIQLKALYGPEHGIRGDVKEGEQIESSVDVQTGIPVYSLYGETKKPSKKMLAEIDVLFFDLQDIGSRYYTYIYTMAYVMEACAEQGIPFVVFDRPNPIGGEAVEGNLLKKECSSFVGLYPLPNRHGLTIGELALIFKHEYGIACDLTVVPMVGWRREMYFDQTGLCWVPPSPNSTGIDMSILYAGTCLVEGTNLSEGRGTTRPFEYIGAPFIDGHKLAKVVNKKQIPGLIARPISFVPTYQKHVDQHCEGVQLHITDRKNLHSLRAGLTLLEVIAEIYPKEFEFNSPVQGDNSFIDLLAGDRRVKEFILNQSTEVFLEACEQELEGFKAQMKPYLLYS